MRSAALTSTPIRTRGAQTTPLPLARRLAIAAERAGRRRSTLNYLMTADITTACRLMTMSPDTLSLNGFLTATVARTAAKHPLAHAYRDWRGRLVSHRHVDVTVQVQAPPDRRHRLVTHLVADADIRDAAEISAELLSATDSEPQGIEQFFHRRPALARVPGLLRAAYAAQDRSVRLRQQTGTVAIATAGTHDVGETFGVPASASTPLRVTIGGVRAAPYQSGNLIERHEILNLTLTFDHTLVDEAEAAAFATALCRSIEHPELLQSHLPAMNSALRRGAQREAMSAGIGTA